MLCSHEVALPAYGSIENELKLAIAAYRSGDLSSAEARVEALVRSHPNRADVQLSRGVIQIARGNMAGGLESLRTSLQLEPKSSEALAWAASASLSLGQFGEALSFASRFAEHDPKNARAHFLLASALRAMDRTPEAMTAVDRALALNPGDADTLVLKARLLKSWKLPALAAEFYRRALAIRPSPGASIDLVQILLSENQPVEALTILEGVIPEVPEALRPYDLLAQAQTELQRFDEAEANWSLAEKITRDRAGLFQRRAASEIAVGRFERAESLLMEVMDDDAGAPHSFFLLSMSRKMRGDDRPLVDRMLAILANDSLPTPERAELNHALGKTFDDLKDYERAIQHYDEANRISFEQHSKQSKSRFTAQEARALTDAQIQFFTQERVRELENFGLASSLPLFIVGMPRSGTTLTSHILSAHSKVKGGGEYSFWPERTVEFIAWNHGAMDLKFDSVLRSADDYLKLLGPRDALIRHVIDKNPMNYQCAAVLHCVFPNAKILHLKRHPVDNLLSMWMIRFGGDGRLLSNRENLVVVYREHIRLLRHMRTVLPEDRFTTIRYEDLTSEPESTIGGMLSYLGLDHEPACFEPEKNQRAVLTPSVQQVRQPINKGSQGRWENYEPWLGAFAELLDDPECL